MNPIAITGLGCVSPVGLSAEATCAALRGGIARMNAFEGWDDVGEAAPEFVCGRVPLEWLRGDAEQEWPGHEHWKLKPPNPQVRVSPGEVRLVELALPAAEEAWAQAGRPGGRVGLFLGLDDHDTGADLADALAKALGVRFEVRQADRLGRAAGLAALHRAARQLEEGRVEVALVGAVDSRLRRSTIERMLAADTLRTEDNPFGVLPGEAAGFLVLRADASRATAWLRGTGVAEEPTVGTERANRGEGLTGAIRSARAGLGRFEGYPLVVNDLNGDRYRAMEWGFVNTRVMGDIEILDGGLSGSYMRHPADCIGDCGAASGGVNVLWAVAALRKGYAVANRSLVWGASDGPLRAAAFFSSKPED